MLYDDPIMQQIYFDNNAITHVFIWRENARFWTVHTGTTNGIGFLAGEFKTLKEAKILAQKYIDKGLIFYKGNY